MSRAERVSDAVAEMQRRVWREQRGECHVCGKRLMLDEMELAHRVPQDKPMLRRYGEGRIHHRRNLRGVCRGADACNSGVSLRNHPQDEARLMAEIDEDRKPGEENE